MERERTPDQASGEDAGRTAAEWAELEARLAWFEQRARELTHEVNVARGTLEEVERSRVWRARRRVLAALRRVRTGGARAASAPRRGAGLAAAAATALPALARAWPGERRRVPVVPRPLPWAACPRRPRVLLVSPVPIWPPHHGGGVRLYNLVARLGPRVDLYVLVFARPGVDPDQVAPLAPYCRRVVVHPWDPCATPDPAGRLPRSARAYASPAAALAVHDLVLTHGIDIVQLEYTQTAQYATAAGPASVLLTEHDVAFRSQWRRLRRGFPRRFPETALFGSSWADWLRLAAHELDACRRADRVHCMSEVDASFLAAHLPAESRHVSIAANGVDAAHFAVPEPRPHRAGALLVGNFENAPNLDALEWFLTDVWPLVRLEHPHAPLRVVGAKAGERVTRWHGRDGVEVVGEVEDLRPYYHGHRVLVAPIRAGSGTRLKLLEAFAAGLTVVSTRLGAEGLPVLDGVHALLADEPVAFAAAVGRVLGDDHLADTLAWNARELAVRRYDWDGIAESLLREYQGLVAEREEVAPLLPPLPPARPDPEPPPDVSVVIPTRCGGAALLRCLEGIRRQRIEASVEVICVDSGSPPEELEAMTAAGATVITVPPESFNHGLTRDEGARRARGRVLVFVNQDVEPVGEEWLARLTEPLLHGSGNAAVQGGIVEAEGERFFWDSNGPGFYFTRESDRWIERYGGIGFSTVSCAIRREAWERHPFGWAPIMEDKKWQRTVAAAGEVILARPDAVVAHSHRFGLRGLARRCRAEGAGWRLLGERYRVWDAARDLVQPRMWWTAAVGVATGRVRSAAELLYPVLRPLAVWWGNRAPAPYERAGGRQGAPSRQRGTRQGAVSAPAR